MALTTWTELAEQLRLAQLATERFLALWAAEALLDAPPAWQRLHQTLEHLPDGSDTQTLPADSQADA